jgi:hypothetical protein
MIKHKLTALLVLTTLSCSHTQRNIASAFPPPDLGDLLKASEEILEVVEAPSFNSKSCKSYLGDLEKSVDGMDLTKLPLEDLKNQAQKIADNSWRIRSTLHARLADFDKECVFQIQANFRQFRFIEDYLLEIAHQVEHLSPSQIDFQKQPVPMRDSNPEFYVNRTTDAGKDLKFEDGDMLVTRGVSFLSSMIARLGSRATQFSHIVFVHKDDETQKLTTIESYVGVGVKFYDFEFALKNENARILWLRAKDRGLAKRAAVAITKKVEDSLKDGGKPIKYDYELNFENSDTMSCAEVSQVAFEMGTNPGEEKFTIPYYKNLIMGAESLVTRLKIKPGPTYEPGDMEIDPRFELMGEFQDLRLTRDSRQKDAIMSEVFRWMNHYSYQLVDSSKSKMAGGVIWKVRRTFLWPLVKKALGIDEFSKEIPPNMLSTVTLINQIGEILVEEMKAQDIAFEKKHGMPMSAIDMANALEKYRQADLKLYENKKTRKLSKIHSMFRAK